MGTDDNGAARRMAILEHVTDLLMASNDAVDRQTEQLAAIVVQLQTLNEGVLRICRVVEGRS